MHPHLLVGWICPWTQTGFQPVVCPVAYQRRETVSMSHHTLEIPQSMAVVAQNPRLRTLRTLDVYQSHHLSLDLPPLDC